jgi:hypothetical protein
LAFGVNIILKRMRMKRVKKQIIFLLLVLSCLLAACNEAGSEKEREESEKPRAIKVELTGPKTAVYEKGEDIKVFTDTVTNASEMKGMIDARPSDYTFKITFSDNKTKSYFLWLEEESNGMITTDNDTSTWYRLAKRDKENLLNLINYDEVREIAWNFLIDKGWNGSAKENGQNAKVTKTIADSNYELLDNSYEGKQVVLVSFEDKENVVVGTPLVLIDPNINKVIGYMLVE